MEDLTGKQLGPYQVVAPLGQGGMAAVYKAYQPNVDRYVALKILPRHFANDPQFVARFEQEAKVLAKLQHPHILPVHDYGAADGYTYIVMPFIQNGTLADLLKGRRLPLAQIGRIISQIGDALDYAHSRGLVHRDIKPSNVLLDERGNCLLTDFGIAKILEDNSNLTVTGGIMGTPAYMSPEQGRGEKIDHRTDIYALGVILYEMTTGRVPYTAETAMAVMLKHINDPLPLPRTLNPALPEGLERVILKSLAKQPSDRFASAGEMVKAVLAETMRLDVSEDGKTAVGTSVENTMTASTPKVDSQPKRIAAWWVGGLIIGGAALALVVCGLVLGPQIIPPGQAATATAIAQAQIATAAAQTEARATATAKVQANETAQAIATASANAQATVQAATALAQAERNSTATAVAAATSTAQTAPTATAHAESTATAVTQLTAIARNEDLLRDDFSSNRNNWWEGEASYDSGEITGQITEGKYRLSLQAIGDYWDRLSLSNFSEKDSFISVKAKVIELTGPSGDAGIEFVLRWNKESDDFYTLTFWNNGNCTFNVFHNNDWKHLATFNDTRTFEVARGIENVFAVYMQGASFTVYANGQNLGTVNDATLDQAGLVGLGFGTDANKSITVEFDDLVIKKVGP